jgi:hypothetical protein
MSKISLCVLMLCAAVSGCSRKAEPDATQSAAPPAAPAASAAPQAQPPAAPKSAHEVTWTDPSGWQRIAPSSAMRKATYKIPAAPKDPEDAEMAVFYFGQGEGGGTEANIQRWIGQFSDAKPSDVKRTERSPNGMKQTIVEVEGTYSGGMPGQQSSPKANYRLIGAVVETPAGSYFFKLTGPKKTVESAKGAYLTLLDSVKSS